MTERRNGEPQSPTIVYFRDGALPVPTMGTESFRARSCGMREGMSRWTGGEEKGGGRERWTGGKSEGGGGAKPCTCTCTDREGVKDDCITSSSVSREVLVIHGIISMWCVVPPGVCGVRILSSGVRSVWGLGVRHPIPAAPWAGADPWLRPPGRGRRGGRAGAKRGRRSA